MTNAQKIRLRLSQVRARLNEISGLEGDAFTDEIRSEAASLQTEYADLETRHQAAIIAEGEAVTTPAAPDAEQRERIALRGRASVGAYIVAAMRGRLVDGAEAELRDAAGIGDGIPLELWDVPEAIETRVDTTTGSPSTVGINLSPIRPMLFAASIAPRLGIAMPRVKSGTFATATITTALTAGAKAKGDDQESTAAAFTVQSATPKRISARLSLTLEDVAQVGQANFESALRENLSLVLSDELDRAVISGNGTAPNLSGILHKLTDPSAPAAGVATFDRFVAAFAGGIDGLWASRMSEIAVVCGVDTYSLSARTFRDATGQDLGDLAFADYAMGKYGGWWTNKRMPDAASNVQSGILYRRGRTGMRTAVCPHWNAVSIDDIYSDSASGTRHFTMHVLLGDVLLVQPAAYAQVSFRVA